MKEDCSSFVPLFYVFFFQVLFKMSVFSGTLRVRIVEAADLKPTELSVRLPGSRKTTIDPYVSIGIENGDPHSFRTTSKPKTFSPVWNEEFVSEVHAGQNISVAVFDDRAIPPDEFVADCTIGLEDIAEKASVDMWVSGQFFFVCLTF